MYVAVKGGARAIEASHALLDARRRGDTSVPELDVAQIREQLSLAVDRVMTEGSVYDPDLAALAIKQARGDLIEAVFLLRAYRTTLPRWGATLPIDTSRMRLQRRVSAAFKDLPGGQVLGPTFDYTQRMLDFTLADARRPDPASPDARAPLRAAAASDATDPSVGASPGGTSRAPGVLEMLAKEGLIEPARGAARPSEAGREPGDAARAGREPGRAPDVASEPADITREPLRFPAPRSARLQNLARGDEGFLLAMAYSTQRGYAHTHPFAGEVRYGTVDIEVMVEELGVAVSIGELDVTECQMINQFAGSGERPPTFTRGYGLAFGHAERKAMSMALVDRALRAGELGERVTSPAQDHEFVLSHSDALEASGFVQHLKLPHYVDFQAELELVRRIRREAAARHADASGAPAAAQDGAE